MSCERIHKLNVKRESLLILMFLEPSFHFSTCCSRNRHLLATGPGFEDVDNSGTWIISMLLLRGLLVSVLQAIDRCSNCSALCGNMAGSAELP